MLVRGDVILKAKKTQKFIEISKVLNNKMRREGRLNYLQKKKPYKWNGLEINHF